MEDHYKLSDTDFIQAFIDCKLNPSIFSHEAHLRLAWININQYGIEEAERKIQILLQNFVESVGAKDKYNTTLTVAAISAVGHFFEKSNSENFRDFIIEFLQLKNDLKTLISRHYSFDIFNSIEAKTELIEPDLIPFK
jgi:N-formylglutamate deformylase